MKPVYALVFLVAACEVAAAQRVPLPRPRPSQAATTLPKDVPKELPKGVPKADDLVSLSACRLRLTAVAVASSQPPLAGAGGCGVDDVVQLEAVLLPDKTRVTVTPPATLRCDFAEAIALWVREDLVPMARELGGPIKGLDNYASYDCRGRNRVVGAKMSEHGKGNALDMRSLKLANGTVVGLTDPRVSKDLRQALRSSVCSRFSTVLGPGSDGYHENHVHVDLAQRRSGHRMCQWDIREPGDEVAAAAAAAAVVPLPRPRPLRGSVSTH